MVRTDNSHSLQRRLRTNFLNKHLPQGAEGVDWQKLSNGFLIAVLPPALVGIWNIGFQMDAGGKILIVPQFLSGLKYFLPLFVVSWVCCSFWDAVFAKYRKTDREAGNLLIALLYVLLLPATASIVMSALGISFGLVFGKLIFGGNGRYLVSPALLGILFLYSGYPGYFMGQEASFLVEGVRVSPTWVSLSEGSLAFSDSLGDIWFDLFVGDAIGAIGTSSVVAIIPGLLYLLFRRIISWHIIVGALLGIFLTSLLCNSTGNQGLWQLPWYWHLVAGNFAFVMVFIATDLSVKPLSRGGCLLYGLLFGFLTIIIRVANPKQPEASYSALMLASILVPLIDWCVIQTQLYLKKYIRRTMTWKKTP